ncbi:hypothetical protein ACE1OE_01435 [Vibrio sp. E150_011]|uniref:hypothetical protein n=1 Tax=Vibrio sp. 10N.261.51.F12 TaxID=3229679 RepID=UPI00354F89E5
MFKYLLPVLFVFSSGVYAESLQHMSSVDHNDQKMEQAMNDMQEVNLSDDTYITTDSNENFNVTDRIETLSASFNNTYITKDEAKANGLEVVKEFTVNSTANFDGLIKQVEEKINADEPAFFSVSLSQHGIGDIELTDYVARVVEYK